MSTAGTPRSRRIAAGSLLVAVAAALAALLLPGTAAAAPASCANRNNNTYQKLLECMTLEGVREHQAALQEIADENGGTRAAGTPGYDASVDYVVDTLEAAGWTVVDPRVRLHGRAADPAAHAGPAVTHASGGVTGSALGTVTAQVTPIDINLTPPRATTSGCDGAFTEAAVGAPLTADPGGVQRLRGLRPRPDRADPAGRLQLRPQGRERPDRRRGRGHPLQPVQHARPLRHPDQHHGGAAGRLGLHDDHRPGGGHELRCRRAARPGRHDRDRRGGERPAVQRDRRAQGEERRQRRHEPALISTPSRRVPGSTTTAAAPPLCWSSPSSSGSHKPQNTLRLAWWGAEEEGLIGSTAYVDDLSQAERDRIALYMNYDMIGSPNYIFMVYDANQSTFPAPVAIPPGSTAIETGLRVVLHARRRAVRRLASSRAGATTRRSSRPGSRQAGSSPAPRRRRRRSSRRSGAARRARSSTRATTSPATRSRTTTTTRSTSTATDRVRAADVRLLDGDGERRAGQGRAGLGGSP